MPQKKERRLMLRGNITKAKNDLFEMILCVYKNVYAGTNLVSWDAESSKILMNMLNTSTNFMVDFLTVKSRHMQGVAWIRGKITQKDINTSLWYAKLLFDNIYHSLPKQRSAKYKAFKSLYTLKMRGLNNNWKDFNGDQ